MEDEQFIPIHGGCRMLEGFQIARPVCDVPVRSCDKYIAKRSRTHDQMLQAARSGVQHITNTALAEAFATAGGFTKHRYRVRS